MTVGMTLGKYAPLHRGHQLVIERSLAENDHTIVMIYDSPELDIPPLQVRSQWLRDLYPMAEVIEVWDGPTEVGLTPEITERHDEYLKRRVGDRGITHFYSSEPYGDHVSRALGAIDRRVDIDRERFPISGTEIRKNLFANRHFLSPRVYRDLITQVVFLGAPSTGKTTIAAELARRFNTIWMPEYGREYWERHQVERRLTTDQLVEIALGHRVREDEMIMDANRFFFIDTDATTTLQFSLYYHEAVHTDLARMADEALGHYDVVFLCDTDIPYDDTWDRSGEVSREVMQRRIVGDLLSRKRSFHLLSGSLDARCEKVEQTLQRVRKYTV
ncbi:MAG: Trifunctional biosynthesis/regulator protein NadR [Planctomycetota bacterium]|jgi:NadR type nicotinamide-nucleotide adenylyltransferase